VAAYIQQLCVDESGKSESIIINQFKMNCKAQNVSITEFEVVNL